jgi:hypothetical protein
MATDTFIRTSAAAALLAAALLASHVHPAAAEATRSTTCSARTLLAATTPSALHVVTTLGDAEPQRPAYGWPVKPFDRQHPVRAFLNDPRIGSAGGRAFHFGIDVAAPDGTPVYAVEGGKLFLAHGSLSVQTAPGHEFGYWHIDRLPSLKEHAHVRTHDLLGHVGHGWGHVHFAERVNTSYVNPLRPGGLGPYTDPLAPAVEEISLVQLPTGGVQILANAYDTTWPPVPGPWTHEPVAPALIQWRAAATGRRAGAWKTAVDFRARMLDRSRFNSVYAAPTAQNHKGKAGIYCFYVTHEWKPADGTYRIQVAASDTRGNRTVARLDLRVASGEVQR